MMGDLGGFLGQLSGKAFDPLIWPFAVAFLLLGFKRKILFAVILGALGAALNAALSWSWWAQISPDATGFHRIAFIVTRSWLVWSLILSGIGFLVAIISSRVRPKIK
jgi:hypothetical protein